MGDRTTVWFRFSGSIRRSRLPALLEAIELEYALPDDDPTPESPWSDENFKSTLLVDECNYGTPEHLIEFAKSHGLGYIYWWAAGGGYGPGYMGYFPITNTEVSCMADQDIEPSICLSGLKQFKTLDEVRQWLAMFSDSESTWPPLEIIDDEGEDNGV